MIIFLCNWRVVIITSELNFGTDIVLIENVVYIETSSGSRYQHAISCEVIINYISLHNNVTTVIVPPFNSIEYFSVNVIDMKWTT